MSAAFVLGNGISRLAVNFDQLRPLGKIYGCNALYREFEPDVLVSTDRAIAHTIQNSGYAQNHTMYTRKPLPGLGARSVPQSYFGFSSGPIAVGLAALDRHLAVYLIGFDMGPTASNRFNNVYADTEFYKKSSAPPTFTGNWARQLTQIMRDFSNTAFVRIMGNTTAPIEDFASSRNFRTMSMEDFQNRINNTKDL
jgi:hypothetical protein